MPVGYSTVVNGWIAISVLGMAMFVCVPLPGKAQQAAPPSPPEATAASGGEARDQPAASDSVRSGLQGRLLQVPVTTLTPGAINVRPAIKTPPIDDPAAAQRGMRAFIAFNCVG